MAHRETPTQVHLDSLGRAFFVIADKGGEALFETPSVLDLEGQVRSIVDTLNRPMSVTTPDQSVIEPTYNEASLLERIRVRIRDAASWTTFVDDIDYDAKGQRESIAYGNGASTTYDTTNHGWRDRRASLDAAMQRRCESDTMRHTVTHESMPRERLGSSRQSR